MWRPRILVVDDDESVRISIRQILRNDYELIFADNGQEAIKYVTNNSSDVALLDIRMPGISGIEVLKEIKTIRPEIEAVMMTAHASLDNARDAIKYGAMDFLIKPAGVKEIQEVIKKAVARRMENMRNRMKELECLSEIAYNLMSARNSMEVEHQIYESLSQIIDYDKCIYFKFDESSKNLKLEYAYGLDENIEIALEQSPIEYIKDVNDDISNDNYNVERLNIVLEDILEMRGVKNPKEFLLTTPVLMEDKLYGFFCVFNSKTEFSEEEKQLLLVIASQIVLLYQRMTSSLSYAEKEAMTRAVGQIAHDMSHAVGIVRGSFQILHMRLADLSGRSGEIISLLDEGMKNLGTLLNELKMLTDPEKTRLHRENVNAALNKTLEIVEPRLSANNIKVITELESSSTQVLVAGGQLFRVFLNLIVNAIEAMPRGGTLKLVTKLKKFDKYIEDVVEFNNFNPDEEKRRISSFVEVTISDTGCGIPDNLLSKIFKFGFTTKDDSNGLGLAEVKRVVNMCGGKIDIQSEMGVGSSFIITLPNG